MSEVKYIQSELGKHEYIELKKTAEKKGITLKEAVREAILDWTREKSGFDRNDPFFKTSKMFRATENLAEKHNEIYED
jgi:hypothetical protein